MHRQTEKAMDDIEWVPGNPHDRSITGFRIRHGSARGPMSRNLYNKLKRSGRGPKESYADGVIYITPADECAWDEARSNPRGTEAKLVARMKQMRHQRALKAGRAAAASLKHISKRRRRKKGPA
jgi:hypothetical protein